MKNLLKTALLALFCACVPISEANGADLTILWDANPPKDAVTSYTIYEDKAGLWTAIGNSATTSFKILNVAAGGHTYAVSALSGANEGVKSVPASVPGAVLNVRVVVTVTLP